MSEMVVIARNPSEMQVAQKELISWAEDMMQEVELEKAQAEENLAIAKKNKWRTQGLRSVVKRATQRFEYYEKLKAALGAGYVIVPNFDIDIFAVRTNKTKPDGRTKTYRATWVVKSTATEKPKLGEGEYRDPDPIVDSVDVIKTRKDGEEYEDVEFSPTDLVAPDFPFKLVKPRIMDDTAKAMALKIFDQIGVIPYRKKKADPMVIGQILCGGRTVSFLITWWLREQDLKV